MSRAKSIGLVALCFLSLPHVNSQSAFPRDADAVKLLNSAIAALGGAHRDTNQDLLVEGRIFRKEAGDLIGTFRVKVRGRDASVEANRKGIESRYRLLGESESFAEDGKVVSVPDNSLAQAFLELFPYLMLQSPQRVDEHEVRAEGRKEVLGTSCNTVLIVAGSWKEKSRNTPPRIRLCLDPQTNLPLFASMDMKGPGWVREMTVQNQYSNYQTFDGVLFPTEITRYSGGRPDLLFRIERVQFRNGFTDTDFRN